MSVKEIAHLEHHLDHRGEGHRLDRRADHRDLLGE